MNIQKKNKYTKLHEKLHEIKNNQQRILAIKRYAQHFCNTSNLEEIIIQFTFEDKEKKKHFIYQRKLCFRILQPKDFLKNRATYR